MVDQSDPGSARPDHVGAPDSNDGAAMLVGGELSAADSARLADSLRRVHDYVLPEKSVPNDDLTNPNVHHGTAGEIEAPADVTLPGAGFSAAVGWLTEAFQNFFSLPAAAIASEASTSAQQSSQPAASVLDVSPTVDSAGDRSVRSAGFVSAAPPVDSESMSPSAVENSAGSGSRSNSSTGTTPVPDAGGLGDEQTFPNSDHVDDGPSGATLSNDTVLENAPAGTLVGTVTGIEADAAATFSYSLLNSAGGRFAIDAATGELSVADGSLLDYESAASYSVIVRVTDADGLSHDQTFTINLGNLNDNAPVISSNGGGATASVSIAENSTAVTTVTATDADAGATLTYSITGGADAAKFSIDAATGALSFVSAPDYENPADAGGNNVYDVVVQVSDGTNTDSQAIAVTVTNLNDNAPVISSNGGGANASVSIAENSTAVTTVTASDADPGATLTYSIAGGADAAKFSIDATTGALSFVSAPDHETPTDAGGNNVYDVVVQVSDGTNTDSQAMAVTVTNVNDNAPVISSNGGGATAAVSIAENTTAVTTVTATDPDAGPTLSYSITGGADAAKFSIDATTGALSFVSAPDHETPTDAGGNNIYDVVVQVSDGTNTDSQAIAVTVTNVNDNAPVISSNGGGAKRRSRIAENSTAVTTVTASDADAGATLTYSIAGGADAAKFTIDAGDRARCPLCRRPIMKPRPMPAATISMTLWCRCLTAPTPTARRSRSRSPTSTTTRR